MKTKITFFLVLILSFSLSQCDNSLSDKIDLEKNIEIKDFIFEEPCTWRISSLTPDSLCVIRSMEEFRTFVSCEGESVPSIDFDKYSLLFVYGWATNGISNLTKVLRQTSTTEYVLDVEIRLDMTTLAPRWNIAILTSKLPSNSVIKLNKSMGH